MSLPKLGHECHVLQTPELPVQAGILEVLQSQAVRVAGFEFPYCEDVRREGA